MLPEEIDGTFDTLVEDMDRAGVDWTLATAFVTKQDDLFESLLQGLRRHQGRVAAQLNLAPNHPEWAAGNLRAARSDPAVAGARVALSLFKLHPVDESLGPVWDACEDGRVPVQVVLDGSKYCDPATFAILARERPHLKLVLSIARARHRAGLPRLARYPSVFFQVPGLLDSEIKGGVPAFLRWAVKNLPHERLMFGSDRLGREASYFAKVNSLRQLKPGVRDQVGRGTALAVYGERLKGSA